MAGSRRLVLMAMAVLLLMAAFAPAVLAQTEPYSDTDVGGDVITPNPSPKPAAQVSGESLPSTGLDVVIWAAAAMGVVVLGGTAVAVARTRRLSARRR